MDSLALDKKIDEIFLVLWIMNKVEPVPARDQALSATKQQHVHVIMDSCIRLHPHTAIVDYSASAQSRDRNEIK